MAEKNIISYVSKWKLEITAGNIFKEYIQDVDKIIDFALAMIKEHNPPAACRGY